MALLIKAILLHFLVAASPARSYSIVRHESGNAHVELRLNAAGEMVDMEKEEGPMEMCDDDYPLGQDGTNDCSHPADREILLREECLEASVEAKVYTNPSTFVLDSRDFQKHPQGCFKIKCQEAAHATLANKLKLQPGLCYFYNPVGWKPAGKAYKLTGDPICLRRKITNGTANTNDQCTEGYSVIMNANTCSSAATCLSYCHGAEFRTDVLNASKYNDFPKGCFVHSGDGCVYYNEPPPNWSELPTSPQGISLCNVTQAGGQVARGEVVTDDAKTAAGGDAASGAAGAAGNGTATDAKK